jgi:hypothetical protein
MAVVAAVGIDILLADSGRGAKLAEFVGLCFVPQVLYCTVFLLLVWLWLPGPSDLADTTLVGAVQGPLQNYAAVVTRQAPFVAIQWFSYCVWLWTAFLVGLCIKVVAGVDASKIAVAFAVVASVSTAMYFLRP